MANEATVRVSLAIRVGVQDFRSSPTSFNADVSVAKAGTPGAVLASLTGTDVDLSALSVPGLCFMQNLDPTNYVEIGAYDPDVTTFMPSFELLPGEVFVGRLSRLLGSEMGNVPGTGTTGSGVRLRIKGVGGACNCAVLVFEK